MTNTKPKKPCITCAFLRRREGDAIEKALRSEIMSVEDRAKMNRTWVDSAAQFNNIVCSKGILDSFLNEEDTSDKIHERITNVDCPAKKWRRHISGQSPQEALQIERHNTQIQIAIITTIIVVVVTVIFGILNLVSD